MADLAQLESRIAQLSRDLDRLRSEYSQIEQQQRTAQAAADQRRANLIASGLDPANDAEYQQLAQRAVSLRQQLGGLSAQIARTQQELGLVQESLNRARTEERARPKGTDSAGQIVREDTGQGTSSSQAPTNQVLTPDGRIQAAPANAGGTTAISPATTETAAKDVGVNAPVVTLQQSQATSGVTGQGSPLSPNEAPTASQQGGVGATGEEPPTLNNTQQEISSKLGGASFEPQPNVLDRYASYTYNAEWHLLTPEEYRRMVINKANPTLGPGLLVRSGGSQSNLGTGAGNELRQPAFDLDFYLDDISVRNLVLGKGTNAAHNYSTIKFRVYEPMGITFLDRLYAAVRDRCGLENYAAALYVMVITFYGYDSKGRLVQVNGSESGDPYAVVRKIIPFKLSQIKFSVVSGPIVYDITGSATNHDAVHVNRGAIPYNIELRGSTVGEILGAKTGTAQTDTVAQNQTGTSTTTSQQQSDTGAQLPPVVATSSTSAPPNASAANQRVDTLAGNLMDALNNIQSRLVSEGIYEIADNYSIEFAEDSIRSSTLRKKLTPNYALTPMTDPSRTRAQLEETQAADFNRRTFNVSAGSQIVQIIDQIIRNSSYITDQASVSFDEVTDQLRFETARDTTVAWYKINMQATPIGDVIDRKRNDYAYDIKFIISFYELQDLQSEYFGNSRISGIHKSYPYWFTGQNNAVLEYQQTYDAAYTNTLSGATQRARQETFMDAQRLQKFNFAPRSAASAQGADNRANEVAANASEFLYDPTALGSSRMVIVGDPGWMLQGEITQGVSAQNFNYRPFQADGTINAERGEVLYEIRWQKFQDYNLKTGLMDLQPARPGSDNNNVQSLLYKVRTVDSNFSQGRFTQVLEGTLATQNNVISAGSNKSIAVASGQVDNSVAVSAPTTVPLIGGTRPQLQAQNISGAISGGDPLDSFNSDITPLATQNSASAAAPAPENPDSAASSNADIVTLPTVATPGLRATIITTSDPQIMSKEF